MTTQICTNHYATRTVSVSVIGGETLKSKANNEESKAMIIMKV